jgi:16S rRNA (guanine1207-N2)-methyltransferase
MAEHYFDEPSVPSDPRSTLLSTPDGDLELRTDRGVFSHGHVDHATRLLLAEAPDPPTSGRFLDLGCGYGPIALTLARRRPEAEVWAIDVNPRALELTRANAAANGLSNVQVAHPDEVPSDLVFDLIWSNPPIRIGKAAVHDVLTRWLERLAADGIAVLVVGKNLGADSLARWLTESGHPTVRRSSARGFRVLVVSSRRD